MLQLNPIVVEEPTEEVARQRPKPPLMKVREDNDVACGGFGLSSLPGTIHSSCAALITGRRSPSSMSHDMVLLKKLEHPHGSIKRARRHSDDKGNGGGTSRVSSQSVSVSLSLSISCLLRQLGNASASKAESRGVRGKGKPLG
jgi:hypothetical protein